MKNRVWDKPLDFTKLERKCYPKKKWDKDPAHLSQLHVHWPYGDKGIYDGGIYGVVDLTKIDPRLRCKRMSRDELIVNIYREVADAMHYPVVFYPQRAFEHQAQEAFAMWHLIRRGWDYWQDPKDIPKPWKKTALTDARRYIAAQLRAHGDNPGAIWRCKGDGPMKFAKHFMSYWPKHGRLIHHRPPIERMTVDQLQAIYVIVCDSFENQC